MNPFVKAELNFLNAFNELIGLFVSYMLLPLQDVAYNPDDNEVMGNIILYIFYVQALLDLTVIALIAGYDTI